MKPSSIGKHKAVLLGLLIASAALPGSLIAGSNQTTSQGATTKWNPGAIPFIINPGGVPGFTGELDRLVVAGAVRDAFRAWTVIPGAAITFNDLGLSTTVDGTNDGVNLISFQPSSFNFPPGVLAVTSVLAVVSTGRIVDADIAFNPQPISGPWSPVGGATTTDLIAVATHEIGHLLGLGHSGVSSSIMNPALQQSLGVANRTIQSDDAITIAQLYPVATFAASTGSIAGTITDSQGAAVKSAHAIAISVPGGVPVASQLSGTNGNFRIDGLAPGNYRLTVEPLDGPIALSDMGSFYSNGRADFTTTILGGFGSPTTIIVTAGQTAQANVQLLPNPPSNLNIEFVGLVVGGIGFLATRPIFVPRGLPYLGVASETSRATNTTFGFSSPDVTLVGSTVGGTLGTTPVRSQNFTVAAGAALGPSNLALSNGTVASVMPGGVIVTVNPQAAIPLRDGAGFGITLAPGGFLSIFGTDLAGPEQFASFVPIPTTLAGVSVKIGDRYAPLFYAGPSQINALIPFEVSGPVNLQVTTGPRAGGNTVAVNLAATAPGIFSTNQQGTLQGAILNGEVSASFAAPSGSIPGSAAHPAPRNSVVVIFASGLGPVSPALASGLPAGINGSTVPTMVHFPTVRIGGQVAALDFAGLAPGFVGLYQVNAHVPANATIAGAVPVQITTFEGQTSNTVTIAVSQ